MTLRVRRVARSGPALEREATNIGAFMVEV
mgnify:CR=1 FL=1